MRGRSLCGMSVVVWLMISWMAFLKSVSAVDGGQGAGSDQVLGEASKSMILCLRSGTLVFGGQVPLTKPVLRRASSTPGPLVHARLAASIMRGRSLCGMPFVSWSRISSIAIMNKAFLVFCLSSSSCGAPFWSVIIASTSESSSRLTIETSGSLILTQEPVLTLCGLMPISIMAFAACGLKLVVSERVGSSPGSRYVSILIAFVLWSSFMMVSILCLDIDSGSLSDILWILFSRSGGTSFLLAMSVRTSRRLARSSSVMSASGARVYWLRSHP